MPNESMSLARTIIALPFLTALASASVAQDLTETRRLTAFDSMIDDTFSTSLSVDGGIVAVGAHRTDDDGFGSGSVYLMYATTGETIAKVRPANPFALHSFGYDVALAGNTLVAGARQAGATNGPGAAYIFEPVGGVWTQRAKLVGSDPQLDFFGTSVAISGDTVVVGAHLYPVGTELDAGAAYVFTGGGSSWTEQAKLTASDASSSDYFGVSVGASGDTVAVGAANAVFASSGSAGAVYIFGRFGSTWTQRAKLTASDGVLEDRFGHSIALQGDTLLVGAFENDANGLDEAGAAYVFTRSGSTWTERAKLVASDAAAGDQFGFSVALDGDRAVIGARYRNDNIGFPDHGAAYVFEGSGSTWTQTATLIASNGNLNDHLGWDVTIDGDTAIAGAPDTGNNADRGIAYVYDLDQNGGPYCFGNGYGTPCPCGADGGPREGCANSAGAGGASLDASGTASISNDTFWLNATGVPSNKPGLLLRGANVVNAGLGNPAGDGLLCTAGTTARSQVQIAAGGATTFTDFQGSPFGASSYGAGNAAHYQFWYRDTSNPCSGAGFNFSNAWLVNWTL